MMKYNFRIDYLKFQNKFKWPKSLRVRRILAHKWAKEQIEKMRIFRLRNALGYIS